MTIATSPRILVVEDDAAMAAGIVRGLKTAGFDVELCTNGRDGAARILGHEFDVVVLDLMLPEKDGFEVLELVRHRTATPIIVLTARTDLDDRLRALGGGAADFLPKPFWIEELVARIRLRTARPAVALKRLVAFRSVAIDLDARTVDVAGERATMTPTEFAVLAYLVERRERAVSRAAIAEHVLALAEPDPRTVDSHVARLRRKLGDGASAIVTVWGIGYRFEPAEGER